MTRHTAGGGRRGFTLIEILFSLALMGALMVALNTFVFSMGEIWGRNGDRRLFERHVTRVTRAMQELMQTAVLPAPAGEDPSPIGPQPVRLSGGLPRELLTFELPEGSRLFPWPEDALPDVLCSLDWSEQDGLVLYWHSRLEVDAEEQPPRMFAVSPLVAGIEYDYYNADFKRWESHRELQNDRTGSILVPQRIRLKFAHGGLERESVLTLPSVPNALPFF